MNRQELLDLYFMEARAKLIDIAAFLDRIEKAEGHADFRLEAFRHALTVLSEHQPSRAKEILIKLSDPSTHPIAAAGGKGAVGAYDGVIKQP